MYRLISATPSPYARKVRIALAEKAIPFELSTEVPWNSDTETPRWNPLEKLPVLITADGTAVFESRYVLEWLELEHPEPPLVPKASDGILAMKRFEVIADGTCDALLLLFFERTRLHPSPEWTARQSRKVEGGLAELARSLGDRPFAVGDRLTCADISVGALLRYMTVRWPDHPWRTRHPSLARYSDRLEERPSFRATVPVPQAIRDRVA